MGTSKALTSQLAEELGLTSDQQKRIKTRSKELQKELEAKIAELRANAKKDLLGELSKDQRKKLEEVQEVDAELQAQRPVLAARLQAEFESVARAHARDQDLVSPRPERTAKLSGSWPSPPSCNCRWRR